MAENKSAARKTLADAEGADAVSRVLLRLLNEFPLLGGRKILFSSLPEDGGIAFFPTSGSVLLSDTEDVTGHVRQVCMYPFNILYRAAARGEEQKIRIKEFLDTLGRWLERQPVQTGDGRTAQLTEYPPLESGNREIRVITRTNPGHLSAAYQDGVEDWMLSATLRYENEFDR